MTNLKKLSKKLFSGSIAILFALNTVLSAGFAAPSDARSVSKADDVKAIPSDIAHIDVIHEGSAAGKPYPIYIQDAHSNPSAQQSIRQILRYLFEKNGFSKTMVALEGAVGDLRPDFLDFFKDFPEVNEAIRKDLLAKGELTGAELFAHDLYAQKQFKKEQFVGVEEAELYR